MTYFSHARCTALINIKIQTGSIFMPLLRKIFFTAWQFKNVQSLLNSFVNISRTRIWANIRCPIILNLLNIINFRPFLIGDFYIIIAFVILQKNIIFRWILLNQTAFQNQRLELTVSQNIVEIIHIRNHFLNFFFVIFLWAKILTNPIL